MPPSNTAAWQPKKNAPLLEIKSAPYTPPRENQIVVKNHAVAINPVDGVMQKQGDMAFPWLKYPFVLGCDLAGEVVEIGSSVTRFKVGDRVIGHAIGHDKEINQPAEGAFQQYVVLRTNMASPIPDSMSYEAASVLPLGFSTAACGLYQKDELGLRYPTSPPTKSTGEVLIVWGGSTSVGSNAIQLAVASGYEVITTASPRNFKYVKSLGASQVFDYNSKTVTQDIIKALQGKTTVGLMWIGAGIAVPAFDIMQKAKGNQFITFAAYPLPNPAPKSFVFLQILYTYLSGLAWYWLTSRLRGVKYHFIFGSSLAGNEVGKLVYEDFLPKALAAGEFQAAPEPMVVGTGLEKIQEAVEVLRKGVSAKKVVVTL